jgi:hypothetical protein
VEDHRPQGSIFSIIIPPHLDLNSWGVHPGSDLVIH